jgi:hypothetical protein
MKSPPTAVQKRAAQPLLVAMWSIQALLPHLPLLFPVTSNLPPSPKTRYRSHYRYLGPGVLLNKAQHAILTDFQIALYLIDFSPLERVLAQIYVDSIKGQVPFHPVSMFLCICLRRERNLSWRALARELAGPNGAGWRELFGFEEGQTPSASGLRHFFHTVGPLVFDDLCPRFIDLLRQHGLFPERSTYPGDPQDQGITVTQDGQLHPALSHPSCQLATGDCYQPLTDPSAGRTPEVSPDAKATQGSEGSQQAPQKTEATSGRQCRARENGLPGCPCDTPACRERCRRASALDPEARFIHYEGHNNKQGETKADGKKGKDQGTDVFGYRSVADRGLDDRFAVAWNMQTGFYPANTDERTIFTERLDGLRKRFPGLKIGEWIDDSGVGYGECLEAIWDLGALRMVDIRHHESDQDQQKRLQRGYDKDGHPLCPHGYLLHSNGYDYDRRRRKYVCRQTCRREPLHEGEGVCPVADCPYLDDESLGFIVNVGKTLPDGKIRLARDIPYGSEEWDKRYGRRNVSESRNGQMEGMGLKRMKSYGLERNTKEVQVADFLMNLRTLGRLVREATNLAEK